MPGMSSRARVVFEGVDDTCGDGFAFAADDDIDLRFLHQHVFPVVGGENPAIDQMNIRHDQRGAPG